MFKYYNPHIKGLVTNDCVKRAIHVCTGADMETVSEQLNAFRKVTGAKRFNTDQNPHRYVEDVLSAERITPKKRMTVAEFCTAYPSGKYILDTDGHWCGCVDGVVYDVWDCREELINFAYSLPTTDPSHPDIKKQVFRYCATAENKGENETRVRIYDGNGAFVERTVPKSAAEGYLLCLSHLNYKILYF